MCDQCKEYRGVIYHLRPNGRYKRGQLYLAHVVYETEVGPIPPGYEVHHKDFHRSNDSVENLEALPQAEHAKVHSLSRSQQSRSRYLEAEEVECICIQCQSKFMAKKWGGGGNQSKFCSRKCLEDWRKIKFIPEERLCEVCKSPYQATRPFQKYCSKKCNGKANRIGRSDPYQRSSPKRRKISESTSV